MSTKGFVSLIVLIVGLLIAFNTVYVVTERERAIMLEFGRLVQADIKPGLHFKKPWAKVSKFDARLLTADMTPESFFTVENKRLVVDSYIKWQVKDVETYYKATNGDEATAENRLAQRVADGLRNQFGRRTLHDVVSGKRDELMSEITASINVDALKLKIFG
jgi:membrane protease subunit HflC